MFSGRAEMEVNITWMMTTNHTMLTQSWNSKRWLMYLSCWSCWATLWRITIQKLVRCKWRCIVITAMLLVAREASVISHYKMERVFEQEKDLEQNRWVGGKSAFRDTGKFVLLPMITCNFISSEMTCSQMINPSKNRMQISHGHKYHRGKVCS